MSMYAGFESMLKQISNKDCMFDDAGNRCTANHLRLQTVKFPAGSDIQPTHLYLHLIIVYSDHVYSKN